MLYEFTVCLPLVWNVHAHAHETGSPYTGCLTILINIVGPTVGESSQK